MDLILISEQNPDPEGCSWKCRDYFSSVYLHSMYLHIKDPRRIVRDDENRNLFLTSPQYLDRSLFLYINSDNSPAEPSVDLDLEYIENVFRYLES